MSGSAPSVGEREEQPPLEQVVGGVTTALILLVAFGLLALEVSWFWIVFPVGFAGVLPAAIGVARYYQQSEASEAGESAASDDPVEALKDRYARGEIDEAEFERRLDDLLNGDGNTEASVDEPISETADRETARE